MTKNNEEFEVGGDNVFADLGFADSDERLTKADLAIRIASVIEERKLTQIQAAEITGVPQPKISLICRGLLKDFSTDRLCRILNSLGVSISIVLTAEPGWKVGTTHVRDTDDASSEEEFEPVAAMPV